MDKSARELPLASMSVSDTSIKRKLPVKRIFILAIVAVAFCTFQAWKHDFVRSCVSYNAKAAGPLCLQAQEIVPKKNAELWDSLSEQFTTDAFEGRAIDWLAGAVRIP